MKGSGGGPHAVFLLDAFNAAPDVSNWVTAGNAMGQLAGKGISVVAPAGGAWSLYTNWENDGSKQWAYKGKPLYTWVKDTKPGDMTGDNVNNVWHVAKD